ncbi:MAG: formyl transferase [Lachnospiraceae bacterium]|nr:formyl transferase [Lachnospiraceae bacterium]
MKILLLSNNDNVNALKKRLTEMGEDVILYHDRVTVNLIEELEPEFVIVYNYRSIIKEDVIDLLGNRIINLHTSYLPWNKGSSPNIWSFIEDTPKGVTIHRLEKGLDKGKILLQKELFFDEEKETLCTTYEKLNEEIVSLLCENWDDIKAGKIPLKEQEGTGSYHRTADLEALLGGRKIDYSMTVGDFKKFIAECRKEKK